MTEKGLPEQIGKYIIQGILGRGAMGVVYRGFDPHIERTVAIKVIRKAAFADDELREALGRFRREAQAAGRLIHPNIVTVYEYGEENDTAFIVMEYVEGSSLKERLVAGPPLTTADIADIIRQLLAGLIHAHDHNIIHRDIKPDNLIFTRNNVLKVMDFGVARLESSSLTMAGSVMGTPSYMAPELFHGGTIDQRSDLFSVGVILYQLLTGHRPFSGSSMTAVMHQVVNIMPTKPSQLDSRLPDPLDVLIHTCLAKNPAERFQNGKEFLAALDKAFAKVNSTLVIRPAHQTDSSGQEQEATCFAAHQPTTATIKTARWHRPLPFIVLALALLIGLLITLRVLTNDAGQNDADQQLIQKEAPQEPQANQQPPRLISPTAAKKEVASQEESRPRNTITITAPAAETSRDRRQAPPPSRNAITITVPDR